jgi:hypothetical protein
MTTYIVPKEDKMFWGSEFMNAKGIVMKEIAQYRLELHIKQHGLATDRGFKTDDELRQILKTDKGHLTMAEALTLLGFDVVPPGPIVTIYSRTCPVKKEEHNFGRSWRVYDELHDRRLYTATCQDCGYVWKD